MKKTGFRCGAGRGLSPVLITVLLCALLPAAAGGKIRKRNVEAAEVRTATFALG